MSGRPVDDATLSIHHDNGSTESHTLFPSIDGEKLTHKIKLAEDGFAYRWRAGDGQTDWQRVAIADRPEIAAIRLSVAPPAYTLRKANTRDKLPKKLSVIEGSKVTFELLPGNPQTACGLAVNSITVGVAQSKPVQMEPAKDGWFQWEG